MYQRLATTFGHAAHFDRQTFCRTFFTKAADKALLLREMAEHTPVGDAEFAFSDVERALQRWILEMRVLSRTETTAEHAQNRAEREQLRRLLDNHVLCT